MDHAVFPAVVSAECETYHGQTFYSQYVLDRKTTIYIIIIIIVMTWVSELDRAESGNLVEYREKRETR